MSIAISHLDADAAHLRRTRREMLASLADILGTPELTSRTVRLAGGDAVQVDGATPDESLIVEVDTIADPSAEGLRARIGQAVLTLALVRRHRPQARVVLLVPTEAVREAAMAWLPGLTQGAVVQVIACGS